MLVKDLSPFVRSTSIHTFSSSGRTKQWVFKRKLTVDQIVYCEARFGHTCASVPRRVGEDVVELMGYDATQYTAKDQTPLAITHEIQPAIDNSMDAIALDFAEREHLSIAEMSDAQYTVIFPIRPDPRRVAVSNESDYRQFIGANAMRFLPPSAARR
jgi:hypothetical protein